MNEKDPEKGPIGVFDSGLGGLTVLSALVKALPKEQFIYLGDTARVPYGSRSAHIVRRYSLEASKFLLSHNIKMLVIACNTATAYAEQFLRSHCPVPIIGVIQPGIEALLSRGAQRVGVAATRATIKSGEYERRIGSLAPHVEIISHPCPLLVPLVEEGWLEKKITQLTIKEYFSRFAKAKVEAVVLGCTHYPLLKPMIQKQFSDLLLIDSSEETAQAVGKALTKEGLQREPGSRATRQIYLTDLNEQMNYLDKFLSGIGFDTCQEISL